MHLRAWRYQPTTGELGAARVQPMAQQSNPAGLLHAATGQTRRDGPGHHNDGRAAVLPTLPTSPSFSIDINFRQVPHDTVFVWNFYHASLIMDEQGPSSGDFGFDPAEPLKGTIVCCTGISPEERVRDHLASIFDRVLIVAQNLPPHWHFRH